MANRVREEIRDPYVPSGLDPMVSNPRESADIPLQFRRRYLIHLPRGQR